MYYEDERYDAMGAWHEAGHLVAITALGHGAVIRDVTVTRGSKGACFVSMRLDSVPAEHRGIIALAGNIATCSHHEHGMGIWENPVNICLTSKGHDGELLRGVLHELGGDQALWCLRLSNQAYELLERYKNLHIKLSLELERRGYMSGTDIRSLCGIEASSRPTPMPVDSRGSYLLPGQYRPATAEDLQPRLREAEQRGHVRAANVLRRAIAQIQGKSYLGTVERAMSLDRLVTSGE